MPALTAGSLRRDPADVTPWAETCGQIRCLVEQKDGAAAEVHHVEIADAKLHYHAKTDEFYYVIDGQGSMTLDGEELELLVADGHFVWQAVSGIEGPVAVHHPILLKRVELRFDASVWKPRARTGFP